jgi:hypothetical protein
MSKVEEIELTIEQAKAIVKKGDQLNKLTSNREFKALVLEGYFQEEAARLAGLSGDDSLNAEQKNNVIEKIKAISHARQYFQTIQIMAFNAEREIEEAQNEIEYLVEHEDEEAA